MRRFRLKKLGLLLTLFVAACALPASQDSPEKIRMQLQEQLAGLPAAVISADGLVSYPEENLFKTGAVLPLPGGMDVLDPLIGLLVQNPRVKGVGTVRSNGHSAEYDQLLATQRMEILLRIFRNRGLAEDRLQLTAEVGPGAPLVLQFQPIIPETSAGEN